MTWNLLTLLTKPRIQLSILDDMVLTLYALALLAVVLGLGYWFLLRSTK